MMDWSWKIQAWLYKKVPRLLTFLQQFTIMEWLVISMLLIWIF